MAVLVSTWQTGNWNIRGLKEELRQETVTVKAVV